MNFKNETKDGVISSFISEPMTASQHAYQILDNTMSKIEQKELIEESLVKNVEIVPVLENFKSVPIVIDHGRTLNVNPNIEPN